MLGTVIFMCVLYILLALALLMLGGLLWAFRFAVLRRRHPGSMVDWSMLDPYEAVLAPARAWAEAHPGEPVTIQSDDGLRLAGRLLEHPRAKGTLLLMHGYRSSAAWDFSVALPFYYGLGYSLLLADQRAHGASQGRCICYGVKERRDCRRWAEYLAGRFGPDRSIFLSGLSMGASTVLMAADQPLPANVDGIIADCGFTSCRDIFAGVCRSRAPWLPDWTVRAIVGAMRPVLLLLAGFDMNFSAPEALRHCRVPVLLLHGEADSFVPVAMGRENFAAIPGEKTLLTVPGADHGLSFLVEPERVKAALTAFLAAHTRQNHQK